MMNETRKYFALNYELYLWKMHRTTFRVITMYIPYLEKDQNAPKKGKFFSLAGSMLTKNVMMTLKAQTVAINIHRNHKV